MSDGIEEGWFTDPYARHEARWLFDGKRTKLVRDNGVESYDAPPDGPEVQAPTRIEADPIAAGGADLLRADAAEQGDAYDVGKGLLTQLDSFGQAGAPNMKRLLDGEEY